MQWADFRDKKIGLLGAGKENLSLVPHLQQAGAILEIHDQSIEEGLKTFLAGHPEIKVKTGEEYLVGLDEYDFLFRSPGLPVAVLQKALANLSRQPIITSAVDLFLAIYPNRVIGVTGTKGKGTTSSMIASIIKAAGRDVYLVGNIGQSVFDSWDELMSGQTPAEVVMELSSFQLEDVKHSPAVAVILPVTEDHLQPLSARSPNFHSNVEAYWQAKAGIVRFQKPADTVVYVANDPGSRFIAEQSPADTRFALSTTNPSASYYLDGTGVLRSGHSNLEINFTEAGIQGEHLWLDAALAAIAVMPLPINDQEVVMGLKSFKPLPHRMEKLSDTGPITVVDDSYATTPDAAMAALTAFSEPIIWLAGGSSKGADFSELAKAVSHSSIEQVILIGQEADRLEQALKQEKPDLPVSNFGTDFGQAVQQAIKSAEPGNVILLSPACASKDMFQNAEDRGNQFQEAIKAGLSGGSSEAESDPLV